MNKSALWIALGFPLALAACGGGDEGAGGETAATDTAGMQTTVAAPTTTPATDTAMAGMNHGATTTGAAGGHSTLTLNALDNSGITGDAMLMAQGANTEVTLTIRGAPDGSKLAAHIHQGRCASGGPVVAPLDPVTTGQDKTGSSTTVVSVPAATVMNGQHYVQAHEPNGSPGKPVTCADIPQQGA